MKPNTQRRRLLEWLATAATIAALSGTARAESIDRELLGEPEHKLVYQFNKADPDYMQGALFSVGEMLREHGDNIHLVVTAIGPGIHILAKNPQRPVPEQIRERVSSLAAYGVSFHACGNTMESLKVGENDLFPGVKVVPIGVDDLMQLQRQGYAYVSW